MPTFAERQLVKVYRGRAKAGSLGFRPHTAKLVFEFVDPDSGQSIVRTETPLVNADNQPARLVRVKAEDVPFGNAPGNTLKYGPLTPAFSGGGTDLTPLIRELDEGESRIIVLTGPEFPDGERFRLIHVDAQKALRIMLFLQAETEALDGYA